MSDKEPTSFYYVIPGEVMHDSNLTIYEKMLYGLISGLSNKYGYCFASNEWIGKVIGLQEKQIQRYLRKMENSGYLRREIHSDDKNPFKKQRHIYLNTYFKKSLRGVSEDGIGGVSEDGSVPSSMTGIISEDINIKSEDTHKGASKEAEDVCKNFIEKIKEANPKFKEPKSERWEKEFDCIIKEDKRDIPDLYAMIAWIFKHPFWKSRCLSPSNIRKNFDTIYMQMQGQEEQNSIEDNRSFALLMKKKYPDQTKNLTINQKYAMNLSVGKEVPFSLPEATFRNAFCLMFGARYEPNRESREESDMDNTE